MPAKARQLMNDRSGSSFLRMTFHMKEVNNNNNISLGRLLQSIIMEVNCKLSLKLYRKQHILTRGQNVILLLRSVPNNYALEVCFTKALNLE